MTKHKMNGLKRRLNKNCNHCENKETECVVVEVVAFKWFGLVPYLIEDNICQTCISALFRGLDSEK